MHAGSPPRVRGTGVAQAQEELNRGITPACAGNSSKVKPWSLFSSDHPRVCGEQAPCGTMPTLPRGSPPRVRGTATANLVAAYRAGITPACAGNRTVRRSATGGTTDHPRVCGEQIIPEVITVTTAGSPPRVRGTGG